MMLHPDIYLVLLSSHQSEAAKLSDDRLTCSDNTAESFGGFFSHGAGKPLKSRQLTRGDPERGRPRGDRRTGSQRRSNRPTPLTRYKPLLPVIGSAGGRERGEKSTHLQIRYKKIQDRWTLRAMYQDIHILSWWTLNVYLHRYMGVVWVREVRVVPMRPKMI